MYLQILKRDIKRKVTMNVILFLFIVLSSMFISSSVNNILKIQKIRVEADWDFIYVKN